jgi:hypothetical protein
VEPWDLAKLAGIEPTEAGYSITPHLPFASYSLSLPRVGVDVTPSAIRGLVAPEAGGRLVMRVALPASARAGPIVTWAEGRPVPHSRQSGGKVAFRLPTIAGQAADWAVTVGGRR